MRKPGCLRAFVCAVCVPALVVCASFVPVACFSTVPLLRSHCHAHTVACGRFLCSRGWWKSRLAVGVFARWVVGFRVYARGVFVWACLRALVLALWWGGGAVWSRRPSLRSLPSGGWGFGAHAFGVGAACVCPMGGGRPGRGGTIMSRPITCVGGATRLLRARGERKRVGGARPEW